MNKTRGQKSYATVLLRIPLVWDSPFIKTLAEKHYILGFYEAMDKTLIYLGFSHFKR
jgi:hypothetical protein